MKRTAGCLLLALLGASAGWAQGELSERGQRVIDYLLADWQKHMHSTGVEQAMLNLGMEPDDGSRLRIGEHLRAHTDLHFNLRSWGPNNYLLSDQEKRIAKFLIQRFQAEGALPAVEAAGPELGIEPEQLRRRLAFLIGAGFLEESDEAPGYRLTGKYLRWGGPLRFNYHTISIGEEDPFAVWWAVDFLLVVTSEDRQGEEYRDVTFRLDDSCAHCHLPITVEVRNGKIVSSSPDSVYVQQGGGWAVDNLFWSEEHLQDWLSENRAYSRLRHMPLREFLEWIRERRN